MKTKRILTVFSAVTITAALLFTACKKKEEEKDSDTSAATDNNYAEGVANDITNIGDQVGNSNNSTLATYKFGTDPNTFMVGCADSIRRDTVSTPKTITVYFGGNMCQDGRTRSGSLKFSYANGLHYRDSGVVITVTPTNYKVDGNLVTGTKTITNLGRTNGNFRWNVTANIQIQKTSGGIISWSCNRTKELLNTAAVYNGPNFPINWLQAKIAILAGGTANGTTAAGNNFTATITSNLVRDFTCSPDPSKPHRHPFISGAIDFQPDNKPLRHIDFGNGNCDNDATVTINGNTYHVTLH